MQVVYSGGSSKTAPSPRVPRKINYGYGQPFMPGYHPGQAVPTMARHTVPHQHHTPHRKVKDTGETQNKGDASLRDHIPAMRKPLAVTCLACNVLLPGLGTFISGLTVLCCSEIRQKGDTKLSVVRVNTWVALLQFLTSFLFLLGWIWSVMWGAAFLAISDEFYKKPNESNAEQPIPMADSSNGSRNRTERNAHAQGQSSCRHAHRTRVGSGECADTPQMTGHPMIVLQEPPVVSREEISGDRTKPILGHINPRQQRIMCRQMSEDEFSPFQLTNQRLEDIIIHDGAPVANGNGASGHSGESRQVVKHSSSH